MAAFKERNWKRFNIDKTETKAGWTFSLMQNPDSIHKISYDNLKVILKGGVY